MDCPLAKYCPKPLDVDFLEKGPRFHGERIFALVAFGDTIKFKEWTNHPFSSPEKYTAFLVQLYNEFVRFRNGSGYFVKLLGDGLMAVQELVGTDRMRAEMGAKMLIHAARLSASIDKLISKQAYPRPAGFRIRVVVGDVLKLAATRGKWKREIQIDYADYPVSLTYALLQVAKTIPSVCHESVYEIIRKDKASSRLLDFTKVRKPLVCPEGVDASDLSALWSFQERA